MTKDDKLFMREVQVNNYHKDKREGEIKNKNIIWKKELYTLFN